ncbi:MAG: TetR/AcrR family transcriptional regulator [Haloechinothrix sp.]
MSTRESLLRGALRVIGEHGVAGLTNRRIATQAGVSLGSLTYHFASQQELLREAMLLFAQQETEKLAAMAEANRVRGLDAQQAAVLVEQVIEQMTMGPDEIAPLELYLHAGRDPSLREASTRCFAAYEELTAAILDAVGVTDSRRLAGPVVALIAGFQLRRLATGTSSSPGTASIAESLTMLARGASAAG